MRGLDNAFEHARAMFEENRRHTRTGKRLQDMTDNDVHEHLRSEVEELIAEPEDILEAADILCVLANIMARRGWTQEQLGTAMRYKMDLRFEP